MTTLAKPVISTPAVVLRVWQSGETSLIASILTEKSGFVRVIAKGARNTKSVLRPLLQPGSLVDIEMTDTPNRDLQYLRNGSLRFDLVSKQLSLEKTAYLLAIVEILDRCRPLDKEKQLYNLCKVFISGLYEISESLNAVYYYKLQYELLALLGLAPAINHCASCGLEIDCSRNSQVFNIAIGGIVCTECSPTIVSDRLVPRTVYRLLQELTLCNSETKVDYTKYIKREIGIILHRFFEYHLPGYKLPVSLDLLKIDKNRTSKGI